MEIVNPLLGLGSVTGLTGSENLVRVTCSSVQSPSPAITLIAYLAYLSHLNLLEIIAKLLSLTVEHIEAEYKETLVTF
ncbi:hypothetical protein [Shouchella patagoniensis]|uniref:hypothetical protein n=1 Tax=Shouchella patagoniensis TaxID=228576 RepID=UPI0009955F8D|nr:hypothetical protein [Shouchella patagoniensis]